MDRSLTPALEKSLNDLGKGFSSEEEISAYIEKLGLKKIHQKGSRSADWVFLDPDNNYKYISYDSGDVRQVTPMLKRRRGGMRKNVTRISRSKLNTPRQRLLLILRRTMKQRGLYRHWKEGKKTAKEFIDSALVKAIDLGLI